MKYSDQFRNQIEGYLCADTGGIDLSDGDLKSTDRDGSSYYFTVDTCANIAEVTGSNATCKTNQESLDAMNLISVDWKLVNAFFSSNTYVAKGE